MKKTKQNKNKNKQTESCERGRVKKITAPKATVIFLDNKVEGSPTSASV